MLVWQLVQHVYFKTIENNLAAQSLERHFTSADITSLMKYCNQNSQFRMLAGSFNTLEGGHLISETMQWTMQGMTASAKRAWLMSLSCKPLHDKKSWTASVKKMLLLSG